MISALKTSKEESNSSDLIEENLKLKKSLIIFIKILLEYFFFGKIFPITNIR